MCQTCKLCNLNQVFVNAFKMLPLIESVPTVALPFPWLPQVFLFRFFDFILCPNRLCSMLREGTLPHSQPSCGLLIQFQTPILCMTGKKNIPLTLLGVGVVGRILKKCVSPRFLPFFHKRKNVWTHVHIRQPFTLLQLLQDFICLSNSTRVQQPQRYQASSNFIKPSVQKRDILNAGMGKRITINSMLTKGLRMHLSYKPQLFKWRTVFTLNFFFLLLFFLEIKIGLEQRATMENLSLNS